MPLGMLNFASSCVFSVFSFGCLGRNHYLCSDVCNMLIINGYFRFCDMCATSGANALIVS